MKSRTFSIIPIIFSFIFIYSCTTPVNDRFELIETESPFDFHAIEEFEGIMYATGGNVWTRSNMVSSSDGLQWSVDSFTNKSIFDLYTDQENLFGVGNDGYIFSGNPDLKLSRTKHWGLLRAFTASNKGYVAVGGKDFNKGWIYKVNNALKIDTTFTYENELSDVACSSSGVCIACGYGIILRSNDNGNTWERVDETGDNYNSVSLNQKNEFYIVGYNGSIIQSLDSGNTWQKRKDGHSPLANNKPFRTIKFKGNLGVISGDNGLIWYSENNGEDWKDISINTERDIFDFVFLDSVLYCVSEAGILFRVPL